MILHQVLDTVITVLPDNVHEYANADLAKELKGNTIASRVRTFFAPIAAVLIGIVALKFLFGENKSLAGFIGFMVLAVVVYGLIQFGDSILDALSGTVKAWTD